MIPHKDRIYRPTQEQFYKIETQTEFVPEEKIFYSQVELINFNTSKVHLKGGKRIAFDDLTESEYIHVINGGYYEEAQPIRDKDRI